MNRRDALRTLGQGATAGALAATALVTAQCVPTGAPAAVHDPLLATLTTYSEQLDAFSAVPRGISDEDLNTMRDRTWGPLFEQVNADPASLPAATTEAGALLALRCLLAEQNLYEFDEALLKAALAYFDGRA